MLKCFKCKIQTKPGESTGKFLTKVKVKYPDGKIGSRIVSEKKCCINCSGSSFLKNTEVANGE